ncbi:MAG TPA: DUF4398 domain-containing protein [Kofleriaceae bacterium]|nr:DUF4398 domain-containing protein [Kofleriaceae bacterium]
MVRTVRWVLVTCLALSAGACGPIVYVNRVTRTATDAIRAAEAAEAPKYAPYYYTRAKEYLAKAREVGAHADYQGANRYGRLATEAAQLAEQTAIEARKDPSKRPLDLGPDVAPAKDAPAPAKEPAKPDKIAPAKDAP